MAQVRYIRMGMFELGTIHTTESFLSDFKI